MNHSIFAASSPDFFLKNRRWIPLLAAGFVLFFLTSFQPFQFRFYSYSNKLFVGIACTLITLLVLGTSLWILPKTHPNWFSPTNWSRQKELLFVVLNLFGIATGIFWFKVAFGFYDFSLERIVTGLIATFAIGIFPMGIYKLAALAYDRQFPSPPPPSIQSSPLSKSIHFRAERGDHSLLLTPQQILCIEVQKNYLLFSYQSEHGIQETRLRNRMYYAEEMLTNVPQLVRCHRAFLINLDFVEKQQINAHGGKVWLREMKGEIPISRKYAELVGSTLQASTGAELPPSQESY